MDLFIGIDLGTSSLKMLLVDVNGKLLREVSKGYPVSYPQDGWSEQDPAEWFSAFCTGLDDLLFGCDRTQVKGLSFGGQMHGLVALDASGDVIRPAILWNDGRTQKQTDWLNHVVGKEKLTEYTANIAFAGFTAPKILWMKENEPQNFARIAKIMLPKDYLAYRLTGVFSTDYSDASGTLLLDVKNKRWSKEMCEICSAKEEWLPKLYESYEVTGRVKPEYGLPNAVVTAGAGDNAAAAVGTGTVKSGDCNISLGTSGTVFVSGGGFTEDGKNALHSFAHATGKWHLMGCILSAAGANKWWLEDILRTKDYENEVQGAALGDNGVFFLPYLMGERSPHNDVNACGAFIGMRANTTRREMSLAVLEGVAFALRDCVEAAREGGIDVVQATVCGGGAKSAVWKSILSNVLNCDILSPETEQGPSYGAAMLAMVGTGAYTSVEEAVRSLVHICERISPDAALVQKYERKYRLFRKLYPALKAFFASND